jgi:cell division protease FtsH
MPSEDKFLTTRAELLDTMAMTLGGRAAEEIIFQEITTGASNDLEKVTATAKQMVMRFGMSEKLGPRVFGHDHGQPFLGRDIARSGEFSRELGRDVDREIQALLETALDRAHHILTDHAECLHAMANVLSRRETIGREQFLALLAGMDEAEVFEATRPRPASPLLQP